MAQTVDFCEVNSSHIRGRLDKYHPRWPSEGFKSLDEDRQWVVQ